MKCLYIIEYIISNLTSSLGMYIYKIQPLVLSILFPLKQSINSLLSLSFDFYGYLSMWFILLTVVLSIVSTFITKWFISYLPKKCFQKNEILIKIKTVFIVYLIIGLVFLLSFNSVLLLFLLFIFLNITIPLFIIDYKIGYLPDILTYPLLWLGLLYQIWLPTGNLVSAIYAVILSYSLMLVLAALVENVKKQAQMGRGDFKLIAACAAWLGVLQLPYFLLLSAVLGLLQYSYAYWLLKKKKNTMAVSIPFGPAIVISATIWLYISLKNNPIIYTAIY